MPSFEPIAIVGVGGLFPGASDLDDLWTLIRDGRTAAREASDDRWILPPRLAHSSQTGEADRVNSTRGCFLDEIPPVDASLAERLREHGVDIGGLDPVVGLALEVARRAHASGRLDRFDPARVGAVFGNIVLPTEGASALSREVFDALVREVEPDFPLPPVDAADARNRYAAGLPAGLVALALDLRGGASTLDAACASSLYALHLAARELQEHRLDAVLAGGISRPDCQYTQMGFSQLRAISPTGTCSPFDRHGNGLVVGEGGGLFALRRLAEAEADGDTIWGVIRGIGLSNDVGGSLLAPDTEGQLRAMRDAYTAAGWSPDQVDLIECHATGTPLGDAIEVRSLTELWRGANPKTDEPAPPRCVLGSVKSNVGHLLTGAGAAGLTKTLLAFRHEALPPTANFESTTPDLLTDTPFRVLREHEPYPRRSANTPRRAAVSAFGFGGINAHLLVEEWLPTEGVTSTTEIESPTSEPIAIVGIGLRSPIDSSHDRTSLLEPDAATTSPPTHAWGFDEATVDRAFGDRLGEARPQFDRFAIERGRYRIPPNELGDLLPQQLAALEAASDAFRDAAWPESASVRTGAFVGIGLDSETTNFTVRWELEARARRWAEANGHSDNPELDAWIERLKELAGPPLSADRTMGALGGIVASRIARELRLGGSSFTVSSEEASSLRALEHGVRALRRGELDWAFVGGVEIGGDLRARLGTAAFGRATSDAEIAVGLVLRRASDADRDGQPIYALIDGIGSASGGGDVAELAARRAQHDRATEGGDRGTTWHEGDSNSSLAPFGHGGAAQGTLAVARAALALARRQRPDGSPWVRNRVDGCRLAEVSSTSVDGTSVHAVLREADDQRATMVPARWPVGLFVVEGDEASHLASALERLQEFVAERDQPIDDLAAAWREESPLDPSRTLGLAILAEERRDLADTIVTTIPSLQSEPDNVVESVRTAGARVFFTSDPLASKDITFVYSGSGNHAAYMGRTLARLFPSVLERLDRENERLRDQFRTDVFWTDASSAHDEVIHTILGQVAFGALMTDVLAEFDVRPSAVLGYSLGETTSLFATRAWTERDRMLERLEESPLFRDDLAGELRAAQRHWQHESSIEWRVGVVDRSADRVRDAIQSSRTTRAYLLIVNTANECVIGGDNGAVREVVARLGATFHPLPGVSSVHCPVVGEVESEYRELHRLTTNPPAGIRFYRTADATPLGLDSEHAADSITRQAIGGFDFTRLVERAYDDGARLFVEVGPRASATRAIRTILGDRPHLAVAAHRSASRSDRDEAHALLSTLAELIVHRVPVRLDAAFPSRPTGEAAPTIDVQRRRVNLVAEALTPPMAARVDVTSTETPPTAVEADRFAGSPPVAVDPPQDSRELLGPNDLPRAPALSGRPEPQRSAATPTFAAASPESMTEIRAGLAALHAAEKAASRAHREYLAFATEGADRIQRLALEGDPAFGELAAAPTRTPTIDLEPTVAPSPEAPSPTGMPATFSDAGREDVVFDTTDCMKLATGSLGEVLGPEFAPIDQHPTRVRLPDDPLMLAHRIVALEGRPRSLEGGRVVTEHDIVEDAWYLDGGCIPTCIAVEAGQADLFLSGYLGIDFHTGGNAVYRLLDAEITFHDELPRAGETIRYDIRIDHFFFQGETALFRFYFDATVDGRPILSMRNGCAGFFTQAELDAGQGIVQTALQTRPQPGQRAADWRPLAPLADHEIESYDDAQIDALRRGDLAACFGPVFANLGYSAPDTIPGGRMALVDRVLELAPGAGRFGLGRIRAELDIRPDDWFLTCHFSDDPVMPGTLMYECCLYTLRIYLLRMGWIAETGEVTYQPIAGVKSRLKCRGQVIPTTRRVQYEVTLKEIGYGPEPYVLADVLMYADGRPVVEMTDMSVRLAGVSREALEARWADALGGATSEVTTPETAAPALFDNDRILAFAVGKPSVAFGAPYEPFDHDRVIARLPGPPYKFLDRITSIEGAEPFVLKSGARIQAQYDVPSDEWYFGDYGAPTMPFAVLLEVALQPCGWLAAYLGSALTSDEDLKFRNLGGSATQHRPVTPSSGTLTIEVGLTAVSRSGGMIIQHYDLAVRDAEGSVYDGTTYFGFFTKDALANQIGIRDAALYTPAEEELHQARSFPYPNEAPHPTGRLRLVDTVEHYDPAGGPHGLGFIRGRQPVDPDAWFFAAHFYQDPVCPGSLGLEMFLELLQLRARDLFDADGIVGRLESMASGEPHQWVYRGQYIPRDREVTVEAVIKRIDRERCIVWADGFLTVDGRTIYQMIDFSAQWFATDSVESSVPS